jgi:hypothetical protein
MIKRIGSNIFFLYENGIVDKDGDGEKRAHWGMRT